jgi:pyridoxamine 5'-phosphate oxidase
MLGMQEFANPLSESDVDADPVAQFAAWFAQASGAGIRMAEAVAVATASAAGAPSVRMVLLKRFDKRGFVFFTNYESRKGRELTENPRAALLFYWDALGRQVRIEGAVRRTSIEESEEYVRSRPRGSQISALASPQSRAVADRAELERSVAEIAAGHVEGDLPIPSWWGGYLVEPESFEFWQHREDRLHDRLRYTPDGTGWRIERLAP